MKKIFSGLMMVIFLSVGHLPALAHEGHGVPGGAQARHGGAVKATKELYIELVQQGNTLMLYPMTHELQPIPLNEVQVEAIAQLPRAKAKTPVKLSPHQAVAPAASHFVGTFDAKGAHRFTLEVNTRYHGKKEKVIFQVEPKS